MDAIIKKIMDIEQNAQHIVNEAEDEKRKLEQNLTSEIQTMGETMHKNAEKKIVQIREMEMEEANNAVKDVVSKSNQQIQNMSKYSKEKRTHWEELLIQRVIGR